MKNIYKNFYTTTNAILSSTSIKEEFMALDMLIDNYKYINPELFKISLNKETITQGGIALSLTSARDCIKDPIRTVRFLKGIYEGVSTIKEKFKNEKITILYAGCGPLGTLIIPILHLFSPDDIEVILLDIHKQSIISVKKIIENLGYESYIKSFIVADATTYQHTKEKKLHIVITETMDRALINEPQVAITTNLSKQLHKNGILIPQEITVFRGNAFFAKERVFNADITQEKLQKNPIIERKKLISITKDIEDNTKFSYETETISIPKFFEEKPDICLYTKVIVFREVCIENAESYITNPICLVSMYNLKSDTYKLCYSIKNIPKWELIEI